MHLVPGLILLVPIAISARGRTTLDRPRHVVALQDHGSAASANHVQANSVPVWFAGQKGQTYYCKLPLGQSFSGLQRLHDDADSLELRQAREKRLEKHKITLTLARWAPLRHRCHAWTSSNSSDERTQWSFRWCFNGEAMMWSSLPWMQRHTLGWRDDSRDEGHSNGSVTLHYVNGTGGRSAMARCNCGYGAPNISAWEIDEEQLRYTLTISMASCCTFRWPNKTMWSLMETFQWLTSPLESRECYLFRREPIHINVCPHNSTLIRRFVSRRSSTTTKALADNPSTPEGSETVSSIDVALGSGVVSVRLVPARPVVNTYVSDGDVDDVVDSLDGSFSARKGIAAVSSLDDALNVNNLGRHNALEVELRPEGTCESNGNRQSPMRRVLVRWICPSHWRSRAPQREEGHTALIAIEQPDRCTIVAWMSSLLLCAHEQLLPPAAEPQRIICRSETPPTDFLLHEQENAGHFERQDTPDPEFLKHSLDIEMPVSDRSGVKFHIGQVVHNRIDGTRGVIVSWLKPGQNPHVALQEVRYLVLLDRRHLPFLGGPTSSIFEFDAASPRLPGRVVQAPQSSLESWPEPSGAQLPLELPIGVFGLLFTGYDRMRRRFVPVDWLRNSFPADFSSASDDEMTREPMQNGGKKIRDLNEMVASFRTLEDGLQKAHESAQSLEGSLPSKMEEKQTTLAGLSQSSQDLEMDQENLMKSKLGQLRSKQDELQRKLDELKQLRDKFDALSQLTETLQSGPTLEAGSHEETSAAEELLNSMMREDADTSQTQSADVESDSTLVRLLEIAGIHEESSIGEELRNALKDIGVDVERSLGDNGFGEELLNALRDGEADSVEQPQDLHLGVHGSTEEHNDLSRVDEVEVH